MNKLEQLRKRMADIAARMTTLQDAADKDSRELNAEEAAEIERLSAEFDTIKADVARREKVLAAKGHLDQSAGRRTTTAMSAGAGGVRVIGERIDSDPMAGFRDAADFARSVRLACAPGGAAEDRLRRLYQRIGENGEIVNAPSGFATEGNGADGGFLVPQQVREEIFELIFQGNDLINQVTLEPTAGNSVELFGDESTPWGATGVKAKWRNEASQMTSTGKPAVEPRTVKLQELYAFVLATDELLEDAPRLSNRITAQAARAIAWESSEAIMWGNGVGKPLGFMASTAFVSVAKESGQAAATVVRQNLLKMLSRVLRFGGGSGLRWMANPDVLPALGELTLGNNGLFFLPQSGYREAPTTSLLGLPIEFSEHCKTLGTQGDLVLFDPAGYYAAQKAGGVKFASSIHLFFDYGIQAFRWTFRLGGQPFLRNPMTPANGSNTRSYFVAVADRA